MGQKVSKRFLKIVLSYGRPGVLETSTVQKATQILQTGSLEIVGQANEVYKLIVKKVALLLQTYREN